MLNDLGKSDKTVQIFDFLHWMDHAQTLTAEVLL